jgi:hypothetical protein
MHEVQAAFIGSGGGGNGTLYYRGKAFPFTVAGLGIGGIGASTIDAEGDVYELRNVTDLAGAYVEGAATDSLSAARAAVTSGCKTKPVSLCT